ncbi:MAG: 2-C-methyl-D-erythritol 4-phosphate cytidylyltransferase [Clostridiales bacterium]|nr:2-C-methyl-D-erythritol 4-phosphate cytidylyltransferase [Clostridiales bacterium]
MLYAEILAGGSGTRMTGAPVPKQFLKLGNMPVLIHTLEKFAAYSAFREIIVCAPAEWTDYTRELISRYFGESCNITVVTGGKNRNTSVMCGVEYINQKYGINPEDIIITHDAVRPFIDNRILSENERAAEKYSAANTVMPTYDTLTQSSDGVFALSTPDRSSFFRVQTPQSFNLKILYTLLGSLSEQDMAKYTDTAAIFEAYGKKVRLVQGDDRNIKITTPFDMSIAQAIYNDTGKDVQGNE